MSENINPPSVNLNFKSSNRLVGWLVSYGLSDQGASFEIRVGRSLLSGNLEIDPRTTVIPGKGIASPHLAMTATPTHTLFVQDIFFLQRGEVFITLIRSTEHYHGVRHNCRVIIT